MFGPTVRVGVAVYILMMAVVGAAIASTTSFSVVPLLRVKRTNYCNYWCKSKKSELFCCGHVGRCPADPSDCSATPTILPRKCLRDNECATGKKCCFDDCTGGHICKTGRYFVHQ